MAPRPDGGPLIVCLSVKDPAADLRRPTTPLLKEEGDALVLTAVAQLADPDRIAATMPSAGLPSGDEPVDPVKSQSFERAQQRLGRDEPDGRINLAEIVGAMDEPAVLDAHAHPYV